MICNGYASRPVAMLCMLVIDQCVTSCKWVVSYGFITLVKQV